MAFKNFPSELLVTIQQTTGVNCLGEITYSGNQFPLDTIGLCLYAQSLASAGGSETLQIIIYNDDNYSDVYASSDVVKVADVVEGTTNWIGMVGFKFSSLPNINDSQTYYAGMVAANYTRSDPFYLSAVYDWPLSRNNQTDASEPGVWMELYGYQDLDDIHR